MKILQILVLILGLAASVNGQKAILGGTLYDANGAIIPNEKVTAINEKGEKFEALTNDDGVYSLSLPFNSYDAKSSSADFRIAKFEIVVDLEYRGFEKFSVKDFKFIPAYSEKMIFDIALESRNPEPCGYSGADCPTILYCPAGEQETIKTTKAKVLNEISQRPLEKLPKAKNKNKRKNKN